jgi:hypothetical protein
MESGWVLWLTGGCGRYRDWKRGRGTRLLKLIAGVNLPEVWGLGVVDDGKSGRLKREKACFIVVVQLEEHVLTSRSLTDIVILHN